MSPFTGQGPYEDGMITRGGPGPPSWSYWHNLEVRGQYRKSPVAQVWLESPLQRAHLVNLGYKQQACGKQELGSINFYPDVRDSCGYPGNQDRIWQVEPHRKSTHQGTTSWSPRDLITGSMFTPAQKICKCQAQACERCCVNWVLKAVSVVWAQPLPRMFWRWFVEQSYFDFTVVIPTWFGLT